MRSYCPQVGCNGFMTIVKDNYVCDVCRYSRPIVAAGAVLQYRLFDEYPIRLPFKKNNRSKVEQNSKAATPAPPELFNKRDLAGIIEV